MKTTSEIKFDRIIKEGFHNLLKPIGFKKKANNFYLQLDDLGQLINIQKSAWGTKDEISFTINLGIFIPEYWSAYYNQKDENKPNFPRESLCLIRKRIGKLKGDYDIWYDINKGVNENILVSEMQKNTKDYILPYFEERNNKEKIINTIENEKLPLSPLGKMIVLAEYGKIERAKVEYSRLLLEKKNSMFLKNLKEYGKKYGIN